MRILLIISLLACPALAPAATTGSISGTVIDPSGGVIPGVSLIVTNPATGVQNKTVSDNKGFYSFPSLPVGRYDLRVMAAGFHAQDRKGLTIDANSALQVDITMTMAEKQQELTVSESAGEVQLETVTTQMGEVVTGSKMTAVASQRAQLYRPSCAPARHRSDVDADAGFDRDGRRFGRHRAVGWVESR